MLIFVRWFFLTPPPVAGYYCYCYYYVITRVSVHFKGVHACYWIPEGDALQRGTTHCAGHHRKGFYYGPSNPIAVTARYCVCGLIGRVCRRSHYREIWGFWSGHEDDDDDADDADDDDNMRRGRQSLSPCVHKSFLNMYMCRYITHTHTHTYYGRVIL